MDDIICPQCGRPNLGEAKKCWYCQTELVHTEKPIAGKEGIEPNGGSSTAAQTEPEQTMPEKEEDIPEWLARIRKKIENEREPEEELPYWKQKDIFGGEKKLEKKSQKEKRIHRSAKAQNKPINKTKGMDLQKPIKKSDDETEFEDLSNDLPDGFMEL